MSYSERLTESWAARALPPRPFLDAIMWRVTFLWAFLHAMVGMESGSLAWPPVTALVAIVIIVIATRIELWRQSELIFLANLGHSFTKIASLVATQCIVFEGTLRLAVG